VPWYVYVFMRAYAYVYAFPICLGGGRRGAWRRAGGRGKRARERARGRAERRRCAPPSRRQQRSVLQVVLSIHELGERALSRMASCEGCTERSKDAAWTLRGSTYCCAPGGVSRWRWLRSFHPL